MAQPDPTTAQATLAALRDRHGRWGRRPHVQGMAADS